MKMRRPIGLYAFIIPDYGLIQPILLLSYLQGAQPNSTFRFIVVYVYWLSLLYS